MAGQSIDCGLLLQEIERKAEEALATSSVEQLLKTLEEKDEFIRVQQLQYSGEIFNLKSEIHQMGVEINALKDLNMSTTMKLHKSEVEVFQLKETISAINSQAASDYAIMEQYHERKGKDIQGSESAGDRPLASSDDTSGFDYSASTSQTSYAGKIY